MLGRRQRGLAGSQKKPGVCLGQSVLQAVAAPEASLPGPCSLDTLPPSCVALLPSIHHDLTSRIHVSDLCPPLKWQLLRAALLSVLLTVDRA